MKTHIDLIPHSVSTHHPREEPPKQIAGCWCLCPESMLGIYVSGFLLSGKTDTSTDYNLYSGYSVYIHATRCKPDSWMDQMHLTLYSDPHYNHIN